ncbi:hypothetical protein [Phorcysia thermohydrogeniphila]|uniref:CRISPR-associated protein Cas02710 family n=1 Tax=Phorcysia thermohydrogeniphila TaxID=936138 RepID=A0A4R1GGW7_9BACT|nr:hypothetical protein [Phorcysia thermohydrogeniphila]TCK06211.1 CRISPR-associated protein Cas02710 family [Phorcysia thermohydrogeniphila]
MRLRSSLHFRQAFISQFGLLFKDWRTTVITGFVLVLLSLIAGWIPDGLTAFLFDGEREKGIKMLAISLGLLAFLLLLGWWVSKRGNFDVNVKKPEKKKVLVLFLSPVRGKEEDLTSLVSGELSFKAVDGSPFRNWEVPLRAIAYHGEKLERLIVLTSPQSSKQFALFKKLASSFFKGDSRLLSVLEKAQEVKINDFEDIEEVFGALNSIYQRLSEDGYKDRDVIVDVTGGQKTVSIAGAFMTLYRGREFQYISTNDKENIKSYDIEFVPED